MFDSSCNLNFMRFQSQNYRQVIENLFIFVLDRNPIWMRNVDVNVSGSRVTERLTEWYSNRKSNGLSIWCSVFDTMASDRLSDIRFLRYIGFFGHHLNAFLNCTPFEFSMCIILDSILEVRSRFNICVVVTIFDILVLGQRWKSYLALTLKPIIKMYIEYFDSRRKSNSIQLTHAWLHIITIIATKRSFVLFLLLFL